MLFSHKVICEKEIKIEDFVTTELNASDSSTILLYGRSNPSPPAFRWSPGWLPSAGANAVGTVWICKEEFLHRILELLEDFNAQTTIVRHDGDHFITFQERRTRLKSGERTIWQQETTGDLITECMEYSWHYSYDASRREGTLIRQDLDSLLCKCCFACVPCY